MLLCFQPLITVEIKPADLLLGYGFSSKAAAEILNFYFYWN